MRRRAHRTLTRLLARLVRPGRRVGWIVWAGHRSSTCPTSRLRALVEAETYLAIDDIGWLLFGAEGIGAAVPSPRRSPRFVRGSLPGSAGRE